MIYRTEESLQKYIRKENESARELENMGYELQGYQDNKACVSNKEHKFICSKDYESLLKNIKGGKL